MIESICALDLDEGNGAIWGTETEDLDATLVRWEGGAGVGAHTNNEVDVVMIVLAGSGSVRVGEEDQALKTGVVVMIPKGVERQISAGADGVTYLNVHKRRRKMMPNMTRPR